jgi:hypothetical protein
MKEDALQKGLPVLSSLVPGSFYSTTLISGTMATVFDTSLLLREVTTEVEDGKKKRKELGRPNQSAGPNMNC